MDVGVVIRHHWDRIAAWAAIAVGALMILIGWFGVSDTSFVFEQLPYVVSGGVGGLFLLGLGAALLLSADLRDEWRKLDNIEHALLNGEGLPSVAARSTNGPAQEHTRSVVATAEIEEESAPPRRRSAGSKKTVRREPLTVEAGSSS